MLSWAALTLVGISQATVVGTSTLAVPAQLPQSTELLPKGRGSDEEVKREGLRTCEGSPARRPGSDSRPQLWS